ncbi:penicillin acylase family protein [Thiopseudomonas alkaliphila]|uniref:penicillin acylase family protein n=1 Tax=Thiopseudomonas alkaliphila TaxID=1697053 RepID=UPI00069DF008|nr:penicillin acylase family protein [Thiopseudomonas alkaliphila]AKX53685.1 penicillin amidase [Thiopseudomonas alkaliphila]
MRRLLAVMLAVPLLLVALGAGYLYYKLPKRSGSLALSGLSAEVQVHYDERGVPHIYAENQTDMYRALGFVHAQDRLFQMEIMRRLANGELAEVLGEDLVNIDKLFRTLRLAEHARQYIANIPADNPALAAMQAYLAGVNHYQATGPAPVEYDLLGIQPRPFTPEDTVAIAGYLAYSFAAAFRTEPVLSFIQQELGNDYLDIFPLDSPSTGAVSQLPQDSLQALQQVARLSHSALLDAGLPQFEGSNAWAVSGAHTASGLPILAGDPHITFSTPAVWYEAHLNSPDFELYGHFMALNPFALLGHNQNFAWSITMFQNDDVDLIAEQLNPDNPQQVWHKQQWVELEQHTELIKVKGAEPVALTLSRSPNGPIITDIVEGPVSQPIALWWAFLETENPLLDAFYLLNRADHLEAAREAVQKIHAPGLNIVWANAEGDIAWWAAAKLPIRPEGVNPNLVLQANQGQAQKLGFYDFSYNPQLENPVNGKILSANYRTASPKGISIPGYYNPPERGQRLWDLLQANISPWQASDMQALQLDAQSDYAPKVLQALAAELQQAAQTDAQQQAVAALLNWHGDYPLDSALPTLFSEFSMQLMQNVVQPNIGEELYHALVHTRIIDYALPELAQRQQSLWWRDAQGRQAAVAAAWQASWAHLSELYGEQWQDWHWGQAHRITHKHPLGQVAPLDFLLNIGEFAAPGGHELPNNFSAARSIAPWPVSYGPSTRRIIDFANTDYSLGIIPTGQSGVFFDKHYADQAQDHTLGIYQKQYLSPELIKQQTASSLKLTPK